MSGSLTMDEILNSTSGTEPHERYVSATGEFYFVLLVEQGEVGSGQRGVKVNRSDLTTLSASSASFKDNKPHLPSGITVTSGVDGYPQVLVPTPADLPDMTQWPHIWWEAVDADDPALIDQRAESYYIFRKQLFDAGGSSLEGMRLVSDTLNFTHQQWVDCAQLRRPANPPLIAPQTGDVFAYWLLAANHNGDQNGGDNTSLSGPYEHTVAPPVLWNVTGRVVSGASPVEGVTIKAYLHSSGQFIKQAVTDAAEGRFTLALPGGATAGAFIGYELVASNGEWSFSYPSNRIDYEPVEVKQSDIDFDNDNPDPPPAGRGPIFLNTFIISGKLEWADGAVPVGAPNLDVAVLNTDNSIPAGGPFEGTSFGSAGSYTISGVPGGTYRVVPQLPLDYSAVESEDEYQKTYNTDFTTADFHIYGPPVAAITSTPTPAVGSLTRSFTLDASSSFDRDGPVSGSITAYAWDSDNDGEFDDGSAATEDVSFNVQTPQGFPVSVRVFDNDTPTGSATVTFNIGMGGFIHTYGVATYQDLFNDAAIDPATGDLYLVGKRGLATGSEFIVMKVNSAGVPQWIGEWVSGEGRIYCEAKGCVFKNGNLYVAGWAGHIDGSYESVLVKLDADGQLVYENGYRAAALNDGNGAYDVCVDDVMDTVYICGYWQDNANPKSDAALFALDDNNGGAIQAVETGGQRPQ